MKDKKVLVFGMARSGIAVARLLLERGARVWVCDAKDEAAFDGALDDLKAAGATLCLGEKEPQRLLEGMDALIVSPGIPVDHPAVLRAKELGVEVMGEVEYAYREAVGLLLALYRRFNMYALSVVEATFLFPTYAGLNSLLMMLSGIILFKDKLSRKQTIGLICGIASVVLMNIRLGLPLN